MQRNLFGLFASLVIAGTLVAAQESQPPTANPQPSSPTPQQGAEPSQSSAAQAQAGPGETTLTGCLIQGSGPNAYFLDNAKPESDAKDAKGQRYALEINASADQVKPVLNSHVRVVGTVSEKVSASESSSSSSSSSSSNPSSNPPGSSQSDSSQPGASASSGSSSDKSNAALSKITVTRITRIEATCPATK